MGFAYLEMSNHAETQTAIERFNGYILNGHNLRVKYMPIGMTNRAPRLWVATADILDQLGVKVVTIPDANENIPLPRCFHLVLIGEQHLHGGSRLAVRKRFGF